MNNYTGVTIVTILQLLCGYFVLVAIGYGFDQAVNSNSNLGRISFVVVAFVAMTVLFRALLSFLDILKFRLLKSNFSEFCRSRFPWERHKKYDPELAYFEFAEVGPRLSEINLNIFSQIIIVTFAFSLIIYRAVTDGLLWGLGLIPVSIFSAFLVDPSQRGLSEDSIKRKSRSRTSALKWFLSFFAAPGSTNKAWDNEINPWVNQKLESVAESRWQFQFSPSAILRLLMREALVAACLLVVIYLVSIGKLKLSDGIVWFAVTGLLCRGPHGPENLRFSLQERRAILNLLDDSQMQKFKTSLEQVAELKEVGWQLNLDSGLQVLLKKNPGLYYLSGSNGSGKSGLLKFIFGEGEDDFQISDDLTLQSLYEMKSWVGKKGIFIESQGVFFEEFKSFWSQVFGPTDWSELMMKEGLRYQLRIYLGDDLAVRWIQKLEKISGSHLRRKANVFSSGERVCISLMHLFLALDADTRALGFDMADSFMDYSTSQLYWLTVEKLSKQFPVFLASHSRQHPNPLSDIANLKS